MPTGIPGIYTTPHERLMKHVKKTETCWLWGGFKDKLGYGKIRDTVKRKTIVTHRISYELHKGPIPEGLDILHSCDNPGCVNPEHLSIGTHKENMWDMLDKERFPYNKLTHEDVISIRKIYKNMKVTQKYLADLYNVDPSHISRIVNGLKRQYAISRLENMS